MIVERQRLTITLKPSVIQFVDQQIDGTNVRNRSHAIETLIQRQMKPKLEKALVLAAGVGAAMQPFTLETPKPLLKVHGQTILDHILKNLGELELTGLTLVISHLGEQIVSHIESTETNLDIDYLECPPTGTAEPIRKYLTLHPDGPVLLYYGDVLAEIDLANFYQYHLERQALATIAVTSVADPSAYGSLSLKGDLVTAINEKPQSDLGTSRLVYAGLAILEPEVIELMPESAKSFEIDILPELVKKQQLAGYLFEGKWFDIGDASVYARALKEW